MQRFSLPLVDPETHWLTNKTYECVEKTLKVVKVKNFCGGSNELQVLNYLIRTGCVMERVDLYEAKELNHNQKKLVLAGAEEVQLKFKRASRHLQITLYSAWWKFSSGKCSHLVSLLYLILKVDILLLYWTRFILPRVTRKLILNY